MLTLIAAAAVVAAPAVPPPAPTAPRAGGLRFALSFPAARWAAALDGRMLLLLSTSADGEPRFQIGDGPGTQQVFGIDVEGLEPGAAAVIDARAFGYPRPSLADVPPGTYRVQGLLHRY